MLLWKGHAPPTASPIDLEIQTQVNLSVLYKRAS